MAHDDTAEDTERWMVLIAARDDVDRAQATARLAWRGTTYEGIGRAQLDGGGDGAAGLGRELAVARALSNLANQLFATSVSEMETTALVQRPTARRPKLTPLNGGRQ